MLENPNTGSASRVDSRMVTRGIRVQDKRGVCNSSSCFFFFLSKIKYQKKKGKNKNNNKCSKTFMVYNHSFPSITQRSLNSWGK